MHALKRTAMPLALAGAVFLTGGCGAMRVSQAQEVRLGRQTALQVEQQHRTYDDPLVTRIGREMAAASQRPDIPWSFRVIDRPEINAVSLPGGPVYIYEGLLRQIGNDQGMLAAVIGHEIGHTERRHHARQIERAQWYGLGTGVIGQVGGGEVGAISQVAGNLHMLSYSRQQEYEADDASIRLMRATNRDPQGLVRLLQMMQSLERRQDGISWFRTHPTSQARIDRAQQRITQTR
jgi:predicted Zn-dependent protease